METNDEYQHVEMNEISFRSNGRYQFRLSYDVDAVTGLFPVAEFGAAITPAHTLRFGFEGLSRLQTRTRPKSKTVSTFAFHRETSAPVSRLLTHMPSLKLGVIESGLGILNVYYVFGKTYCPTTDELVVTNTHHIEYIYSRITTWIHNVENQDSEDARQVRTTDADRSVKGTLVRRCFDSFLGSLASRHHDHILDRIYVELYGCKNSTMSDAPIEALRSLSSVYSDVGLSGDVKVDACVSVTKLSSTAVSYDDVVTDRGMRYIPDSEDYEYSGPTAVFVGSGLFESMRLRPNYRLFFCNRLQNCHHKYVRWDGTTVDTRSEVNLHASDGNRIDVDKVNLYNTIEDVIRDVRTGGFFPSLSSAMLKGGFGIHLVGPKGAIQREKSKMLRVIEGFMSARELHHPYRLEVTVPFAQGNQL